MYGRVPEMSNKHLWVAAVVIVGVWMLVDAVGSAGSDQATTTTTVFASEDLLDDYQDAWGGDVSGTIALYVTAVDTRSWGLEVAVQSSEMEVAEWACGNVKAMLGWERRVEVWSEGGQSLTSC